MFMKSLVCKDMKNLIMFIYERHMIMFERYLEKAFQMLNFQEIWLCVTINVIYK